MAEVTVSQMFADILSLIARLRAPPAPAWEARGQMYDRRRGWRRCALVQANQRVYRLAAVGRLLLTDCCVREARFTVVETPQKGDPSSEPLGIGNVGLHDAAADRLLRTRRAIVIAKEVQGPDHGLNTLGNLGDVGS
jgi:hypothetical protein